MTDNELIASYLAGNDAAFEELYHRYLKSLRHLAMSILHDPEEVEDILQDTFFSISLNLRRFDPTKAGFSKWSQTILWRKAVCFSQKRVRRRTLPVAELGLKEFTHLPEQADDRMTPDEECAQSAFTEAVILIAEPLSPHQRDAFLRRHLSGQTYEQMSRELGTCVSTLRDRTFRATKQILPALKELLAS